MTTWQIICTVIGILAVASWALVIPSVVSLASKLKKVKEDYYKAIEDGSITDAEKITLADQVVAMIPDMMNIIQFLSNIVIAIRSAIFIGKIKKITRR